MNIVYTINGEGMGHASRSSVVIDHLLSRGHHVAIFSSGKQPLDFLKSKYENVASVTGLHMVYRNNKVRRFRTALRTLANMPEIRSDVALVKKSLGSFNPDVVITDFDFHGQLVSRAFHIPIISIDNIQFLRFALFKHRFRDRIDYHVNAFIARMMVPRADYFFVTSFLPATLRDDSRKGSVLFIPPLIRKKILDRKPTIGKHILVYQTSNTYHQLLSVLAKSSERFIVYNCKTNLESENIICKDFDEESFIDDLASAKAVIVNGGFTVISESLYYGKPVLSIPIKNHFEQKLNGYMVEQGGFGRMTMDFTPSILEDFLSHLEMYREQAAGLHFDPSGFLAKLDSVLIELTSRR